MARMQTTCAGWVLVLQKVSLRWKKGWGLEARAFALETPISEMIILAVQEKELYRNIAPLLCTLAPSSLVSPKLAQ